MPPAPVRIVRDLRLDLFRGLALLLIFLDHIPSNVVSWVTVRNYGFSDATEIFIFISGYANAYVYGAVIRRRGLIDAAAWILNRAWQIYLAQIFLFVVYGTSPRIPPGPGFSTRSPGSSCSCSAPGAPSAAPSACNGSPVRPPS